MMSPSRLLVGIGSPFGDDRVGWEIARRVEELASGELATGELAVRCARAPAELLNWLEGVDRMEICDAVASGAAGSLHCWSWPSPEIELAPFRGSHDLGLPAVLALAAALGRLPREVRIWGIGIEPPPAATDALSPPVAAVIPAAIERIFGALAYA